MPTEMCHIPLMTHEAFTAVVTSERKVSGMTTLMADQFITIAKLFLTIITSIPSKLKIYNTVAKILHFFSYLLVSL